MIVGAVIVTALVFRKDSSSADLVSPQPIYFAQVDAHGVVQRVIVATQDFINSGYVGDPASWIPASDDGTINKNYPGIGYVYSSASQAFIAPQPGPDFVLDPLTDTWIVQNLSIAKVASISQ